MKKITTTITMLTIILFGAVMMSSCSSGKNKHQKKKEIQTTIQQPEEAISIQPTTPAPPAQDSFVYLTVTSVTVQNYDVQNDVKFYNHEGSEAYSLGKKISYKLIFKDSSSADPAGILEIRQEFVYDDSTSGDRKQNKEYFAQALKLLEDLKQIKKNEIIKILVSSLTGMVSEIQVAWVVPEKKEGNITFAAVEKKRKIWTAY